MGKKRIYVSTVGRGKQLEESSKVYLVDIESSETIKGARIPEATIDLENPRGGCRGCRGLAWWQGELWAAGFDGLFRLHPGTLRLEKGYWSQECRDIHQIYTHSDGILLTSTWNNCIFLFNPLNGSFDKIQDLSSDYEGEQVDPNIPDTLHMNSLCDDYALFNRPGVIANIISKEIVYRFGSAGCGHDLHRLSTGEIAINLSASASTEAVNLETGRSRVLLDIQRKPGLDSPSASHGWTRGMFYIPGEDVLLIGAAPAMVYILENVSMEPHIKKVVEISDEVVESVFDILPYLEDWGIK